MKIDIAAAINNENMLKENLLRSDFSLTRKFIQLRGYGDASTALNSAIDQSDADVLVLVHQDVYLPLGWFERLKSNITKLESESKEWAILGIFGVDALGKHIGYCWSTGLNKCIGKPFNAPLEARSIDEVLIVLNLKHKLRFDENLKGFHLYGTDICCNAISNKLGVYVINAPVIHNSKPVKSLFGSYLKAHLYLRKKWYTYLPIQNVIVSITKNCIPLIRFYVKRELKNRVSRKKVNSTHAKRDAIELAKSLNFE